MHLSSGRKSTHTGSEENQKKAPPLTFPALWRHCLCTPLACTPLFWRRRSQNLLPAATSALCLCTSMSQAPHTLHLRSTLSSALLTCLSLHPLLHSALCISLHLPLGGLTGGGGGGTSSRLHCLLPLAGGGKEEPLPPHACTHCCTGPAASQCLSTLPTHIFPILKRASQKPGNDRNRRVAGVRDVAWQHGGEETPVT